MMQRDGLKGNAGKWRLMILRSRCHLDSQLPVEKMLVITGGCEVCWGGVF